MFFRGRCGVCACRSSGFSALPLTTGVQKENAAALDRGMKPHLPPRQINVSFGLSSFPVVATGANCRGEPRTILDAYIGFSLERVSGLLDWLHLLGQFREDQTCFPELDRGHEAQS